MSAVLLSPHNDDETLFAAFTILREKPKVINVLYCDNQERIKQIKSASRRVEESRLAMRVLFGRQEIEDTWEQWPYLNSDPDWGAIGERIRRLKADRFFAPLPEKGTHPQHLKLGDLVRHWHGSRTTFYTTYVESHGRCQHGTPVAVRPGYIAKKLHALSMYKSQHEINDGYMRHFLSPQWEYYDTWGKRHD